MKVASLPPELRAKLECERPAALPVPVPAVAPVALLKPDRSRSRWQQRLAIIRPALEALEAGKP
ncbi:MAG TPA: hypothetical protein VMU87_04875, partial [Stellaceae bacterium]|nr:hypothetical protein [Stellaceae bacterium]